MNRFFGEPWDAPIVECATQAPTPVGELCYQCGEMVADGDRGFVRAAVRMVDGEAVASPEPVHAECDLRSVMGHQVGVCRCTGYGSSRADAQLAWDRIEATREIPL